MSDLILWLIIGVLLAVGLAGTILPFLPGTPLIVLAALVYAVAHGWMPITVGRLAVLAFLCVAGYLFHYAAGALGARRVGGSAWSVVGAIVGGIVGLFFGLPGLIIGPPLGAI